MNGYGHRVYEITRVHTAVHEITDSRSPIVKLNESMLHASIREFWLVPENMFTWTQSVLTEACFNTLGELVSHLRGETLETRCFALSLIERLCHDCVVPRININDIEWYMHPYTTPSGASVIRVVLGHSRAMEQAVEAGLIPGEYLDRVINPVAPHPDLQESRQNEAIMEMVVHTLIGAWTTLDREFRSAIETNATAARGKLECFLYGWVRHMFSKSITQPNWGLVCTTIKVIIPLIARAYEERANETRSALQGDAHAVAVLMEHIRNTMGEAVQANVWAFAYSSAQPPHVHYPTDEIVDTNPSAS